MNKPVLTLPPAGVIAVRAVDDALLNEGVHEVGGNNRGEYVETYLASCGLPAGYSWCQAFWNFRHHAAARKLGSHLPAGYPVTARTTVMAEWAMRNKLWIPASVAKKNPELVQKGDLAMYPHLTDPSPARMRHVGGVWEPPLGTIEANTSKKGKDDGVEADGDGVWCKTPKWADLFCTIKVGGKTIEKEGGFVRLPF